MADNPLPVVSKVDINKYMGRWYEIARYPNRFQKDCYRATSEYTLLENGKVRVVNRCTRKDGSENSIKGKA